MVYGNKMLKEAIIIVEKSVYYFERELKITILSLFIIIFIDIWGELDRIELV